MLEKLGKAFETPSFSSTILFLLTVALKRRRRGALWPKEEKTLAPSLTEQTEKINQCL